MFDIGEHEGERFLTMEFVEGQMLSALINAGSSGIGSPLPDALVLPIVQQICAGLSAAHAVGVIHRDLKPDNVMLGNDGRVAITDFGIARIWQPSEVQTQSESELIGTPEYMSPEQAEGRAIDLRTDVYSLGVMLFELLTGTVPFAGTTPLITAAARLIKAPPDPRSRRPELPEAAARVVLRCLARAPAERYASADEVAAALGEALPASGWHHAGPLPVVSVLPALNLDTGRQHATPGSLDSDGSPHSGSSGSAITVDLPARVSAVAVLPFTNQGPPEDSYLAEGLTDDLRDSLSQIPGLRVRSLGALPAQADMADPVTLGQRLAVDVLISGTVRRMGPQLRIAARLVTAKDGVQAWAQRFDRPAALVLRISDEVAQAVAAALNPDAAGPWRERLDDAQAVDLYLRARALAQHGDPQGMLASIPLYEQALALRPRDATLLTAYANAKARTWFAGGERDGELARLAAEQAVAAAPERGESYLALATVRFQVGDPAGAVRNLRKALKLAPVLADAHELLGRILLETAPYELGLRHIQRALELEPSRSMSLLDTVRLYSLLRQWDDAQQLIDQLQRADPTGYLLWFAIARVVLWRRDRQQAELYLQQELTQSSHLSTPRRLLSIVAGHERITPRQLFDRAVGSTASSPRGRSFFHQMETELHCFYGEPDHALRSLARAVDVGLFDKMWIDYCPLLAPVRGDARYPALRKIVADRAALAQQALTT